MSDEISREISHISTQTTQLSPRQQTRRLAPPVRVNSKRLFGIWKWGVVPAAHAETQRQGE